MKDPFFTSCLYISYINGTQSILQLTFKAQKLTICNFTSVKILSFFTKPNYCLTCTGCGRKCGHILYFNNTKINDTGEDNIISKYL